MADALLCTKRLSKDFGGLHAVREVDLSIREGEIHALIGPNGAGKTTLVKLLAGSLLPSGGRIAFQGCDITDRAPHRRARSGIGLCHQKTSVFPELTCLENCWLGARRQRTSAFAFVTSALADAETETRAREALARCALGRLADVRATALSHGDRKALEIAVMLSADPQMLLLDEPLAGMGAEEAERMQALIRNLSGGHTVLLVEHDMDAVFSLADRVTVMVDGEVLATDIPSVIRSDERVQDAYLGHGEVSS